MSLFLLCRRPQQSHSPSGSGRSKQRRILLNKKFSASLCPLSIAIPSFLFLCSIGFWIHHRFFSFIFPSKSSFRRSRPCSCCSNRRYSRSGCSKITWSWLRIRRMNLFLIPKYFFQRLYDLACAVPKTNVVTLLISVVTMSFLIVGKEFVSPLLVNKCHLRLPVPYELFAVVFSSLFSWLFSLNETFGVLIVGDIPAGCVVLTFLIILLPVSPLLLSLRFIFSRMLSFGLPPLPLSQLPFTCQWQRCWRTSSATR